MEDGTSLACIPIGCLPLLVILLPETHVAFLIKDEQCTETHPSRSLSHQSIYTLLTKPIATFGAGRHSPNVQLHITPAVVFIVVVLVTSLASTIAGHSPLLIATHSPQLQLGACPHVGQGAKSTLEARREGLR